MANILVLYYTQTGNTQKMAEAVVEGAKSVQGVTVELSYHVSSEALGEYDALLIGAPTYHHDMTAEIKTMFEEAAQKNVNLKGKIGAAFGSYGWSGEAPKLVLEIMKNKFAMNATEAPVLSKYAPDEATLQKCRELGIRVARAIPISSDSSRALFVQAEKNEEVKDNAKYACSVCGYVYDPILGDPDSGIQPGTPFEKLPENWVCPVCGASKDQFDRKN